MLGHFLNIDAAIDYADELSRRNGPLDGFYADVAELLRQRKAAQS